MLAACVRNVHDQQNAAAPRRTIAALPAALPAAQCAVLPLLMLVSCGMARTSLKLPAKNWTAA